MATSTRHSLTCINPTGTHHISYQQWGTNTGKPPIICTHGLTRNSHDFDKLAKTLSSQAQLICPDIVGRGKSDHLPNIALYDYAQYVSDMATLIARGKHTQVDWIGTSMGGLIGMMLAASPLSPIRRLIINDVGPFLEAAALERISTYVGGAPHFNTLDDVEQYLRTIHAPFAPMSNEDWQHMAATSAEKTSNGHYQLTYDPKIGTALRASLTGEDINLWPIWEAIKCPTLVLRGQFSDLLSQATATRMTQTGPKAKQIEIAEAGHAPSLMSEDQIQIIKTWLDETSCP